jgi:hypothetical protein
MQEHIMRDKAESIRMLKICSISLTLTVDNRRQDVKKLHLNGTCRFSSGDVILTGITFSVM